MRIALDLQGIQAGNRLRGIGRYSHALALELVRRGGAHHEFWLAMNSALPESIASLRNDFYGLLPPERIRLFSIPTPVAEHIPANAWRTRAAELIREDFLAGLAPDMVHISSLFEGWGDNAVTSVGLPMTTPPTAVTLYDLIPLLNPRQYLEPQPLFRNAYLRKVQALKRANLLLAISESSRREALETLAIPADRVVAIGAGVDPRFRPLDPQTPLQPVLHQYGLTRPFIMYTGGIDPRKNIEGLITAYALLPAELRQRHQLAIVCSIQEIDRTRLTGLGRQQGLDEHELRLTGYVDDESLVCLYNACSLFVFPSFHEGFGLPALEAMACGAPVIGAAASSIPEVIGRSDALFDPARPQAIADKMAAVLNDAGFRQELSRHGLQQAQRFTWDAAAAITLEAFEACHERNRAEKRVTVALPRNLRMAYISPLPPQQTGIADYSAELIPELARYYDLTLITEQPKTVDSPWLRANFPIHSPAWFEEHAGMFDRILYHLGNSSFHAWQLPLLADHPGIVVLHDFFLGGLYSWLTGTGTLPGAFQNALCYSHGVMPFLHAARHGQDELPWIYPCNLEPLEQASGIIVHSDFVIQLAEDWYGRASAGHFVKIAHLRNIPGQIDRNGARTALEIPAEDLVVCSFGLLGPLKLNHRLLDAWLASPLAADPRCQLVFVGALPETAYGKELQQRIQTANRVTRIRVTGFADIGTYRQWLAVADMAVQLRHATRGETSGTVLDCLAYGIPVVVNAHGSLAEFPDDVLRTLPDIFSDNDLRQALEQLATDDNLRQTLSSAAVAHIRQQHHPASTGLRYHQQIEQIMRQGNPARQQRLIADLGTLPGSADATDADLTTIAAAIAANRPWIGPRQLFVDISELAQRDAKSGIQRVVRHILAELIAAPPAGYRVEPVADTGNGAYRYARQDAARILATPAIPWPDGPVEVWPGDIFLGLDLLPAGIPRLAPVLQGWRQRGVQICFVVYDLLPILRPDCFVPGAYDLFQAWLLAATAVANRMICISETVAGELEGWLTKTALQRPDKPCVGFFHLGSDSIPETAPATRQLAGDQAGLQSCSVRPTFLMVGTLEPRKGHAQALAACDLLWRHGVDVGLVIIGKQGWLMENLVEQLQLHAELGERLLWLKEADDNVLELYYHSAAALLIPSEGEGFGLPLVEAARRGLPIIARDIPVFREVAGAAAFYFEGTTPEALATAINDWLELLRRDAIPQSGAIPWLTWQQSATQLTAALSLEPSNPVREML